MTEQTLVAILSALAVLGGAGLTYLAAGQSRMRRELRAAEATNEALWAYTRLLIDAHYRGGLGPPPPPPAYIRNLYEYGDN